VSEETVETVLNAIERSRGHRAEAAVLMKMIPLCAKLFCLFLKLCTLNAKQENCQVTVAVTALQLLPPGHSFGRWW
jgi:hypothetical protein